jgi:hypothetical protein
VAYFSAALVLISENVLPKKMQETLQKMQETLQKMQL